ncbi:hypothetical protein D5086_014622 [Populus alba]|uniref:Uncharacterized protein n=1 Tax=Populus alba TaxID=43335 RepID=A0ACC4BZA6_POPAL
MSSGSDCSDATQKPLKNRPLSMRSHKPVTPVVSPARVALVLPLEHEKARAVSRAAMPKAEQMSLRRFLLSYFLKVTGNDALLPDKSCKS